MLSVGEVEHTLDDRFLRGTEFNYWTIEYLVAGTVLVQTGRGSQTLTATSALLIPPRTNYSVQWAGAGGPWSEVFALFDLLPHWQQLLFWPVGECGLGFLNLSESTVAQETEAALREAIRFRRSARINRHALAVNTFERALWTLDEVNPTSGYVQHDQRTEKVLAYIAGHYAEALDLETLAGEVFLSPSRFSHLFRSQMRQAPMQFLEQYRLERAAEKLLSSRDSIEEIAAGVGFTNAFHFSTRFRLRFGQPPSHYRRRWNNSGKP